ncbi:MAG: MG2 domain-containing protein [Desulfobacterales bacterium]|nr:MG2 domain-containing protein [Desulfobacterales bacterium]
MPTLRHTSLIVLVLCFTFGAAQGPLTLTPPDGKVATDASSLLFTLDRMVIPEARLGHVTNQDIIQIEGAAGSFALEARNRIRFYPRQPLPSGKRFSARLNPTFFQDQNVSAQPVHFETEALSVRDAQLFRDPQPTLRLVFNDRVRRESLIKHLRLEKKQKMAATLLQFEVQPSEDARVFLVAISEAFGEHTLVATIDPRLAAVGGALLTGGFEEAFAPPARQIRLDDHRRSLVLPDAPRGVSLPDGRLGIRLYVPRGFYANTAIQPHVRIDGLSTFKVGARRYIDKKERAAFELNARTRYAYDITGDFKPNTKYRLTLKAGLRDGYRHELKMDQRHTITTGDRLPALRFESDKPYLSPAGEVGFTAVNVDTASFIVERLTEANFRYFLNFMNGQPASVLRGSEEVFNRQIELGGEFNAFVQHKVALKTFIQKWPGGVYRLSLRYKDKTSTKVVFVTDIGLSAHLGANQFFVAATGLSDARPVNRARVQVYSEKNALVAEGRTSGDGVFVLNQDDLAARKIKSVVVTKGKDRGFLVLNTVLNDYKPLPPDNAVNRYRAMLYLQRRLIRPGEKLHLLAVLKDKYYQSAPELPVRIRILDPGRKKYFEEDLKTDAVGAFTLTTPMDKAAKTGKYRIEALLGDKVIGRTAFSLETFLPQRIKNRIDTDRDHYRTGETIKADIASDYLFGAPAGGLRAEVKLSAVATPLKLESHADYSFNNIALARGNTVNYLDVKREAVLDADGRRQVLLPTAVDQPVPSILQGLIGATVFDDGREVAAYKEVRLYPYRQMVGIHLADKVIRGRKDYGFRTVLIDPESGQTEQRQLFATLKRRVWHWRYDAEGYYRWSEDYETVETFTVTPGERVERQAAESGQYLLLVADRLGGHTAGVEFRVHGWGYDPMGPTDDTARVEIECEDRPYQKGDVIRASLHSPIGGRLLVALVGEKILWHRFFDLANNTAAVDIPIDFDFRDGLYLHAQVVRPTDQPSRIKPFRAKGYHYIRPNLEDRRLAVRLEAPALTQSNRRVTFKVDAGAPDTKVLVSLVDEGILQIVGQRPPRPFEFFQSTDPHQMALYDLYDLVMHHLIEGRRLDIGGDDARLLAARKKHMAPETGAKRVKPFVFWSDLVSTDADGRTEVVMAIPNFNGRAEVVALAFSKDGIGAANQPMVVRDDVIVKATAPRFMLAGDSLVLPVRVFNTTDAAVELDLSAVHAGNLSLTGLPNRVSVGPQKDVLLHADLRAHRHGRGDLTITAAKGGDRYRYEVELPIHTASVLDTRIYSGESEGTVSIDVPPAYFREGNPRVDIVVSELLLARLKGTFNHLVGYPHGCAEQTSSRMLAMLNVEGILAGADERYTRALVADRAQFLRAGLAKLEQMQRPQGAFNYWKGGDYVNPYASVYASDVVLSAKRKKIEVPDAMTRGIYAALKRIAKGEGQYQRYELSTFTRLYAAYLLSTEKRLPKSLVNQFYDRKVYQRNLVSAYMMAAILKQAGMERAMTRVLQEIEAYDLTKMDARRKYDGDFYSRPRDRAFALYLHSRHFKPNSVSQALLVAVADDIDRLYSTQDQAFVLRALQAYYRDIEPGVMDVSLSVNGGAQRADKPFGFNGELVDPRISLQAHQGRFYYSVAVAGYLPRETRHQRELGGKRLGIYRQYVDEDGARVDLNAVRQGDLIYSRITLSASEAIANLIVSDRVPACFEIVNERLDRRQRPAALKEVHFRPDHVDIRDDRVFTFVNIGRPLRRQPASNTIVFYTPLRVTFTGTFQLPAAQVEAMYDSRLSDYDLQAGPVVVNASELAPAPKLEQAW